MTTFYTKGFKVAGIVEPFNIYPIAKSKAEISLAATLDVADADAWNIKLSDDNKVFDHDFDVYDISQDQLERNLIMKLLPKEISTQSSIKVVGGASAAAVFGKTVKSEASTTREHLAQILQLGSKTLS